jgi:hypothetical protein
MIPSGYLAQPAASSRPKCDLGTRELSVPSPILQTPLRFERARFSTHVVVVTRRFLVAMLMR